MRQGLDALEARANQEARALMGEVAWPTMALAATALALYAATLIGAALGAVAPWLAFAGVATLTYVSYTVVHEAVHGSINGRETSLRWLNEALGFACAQPFAASFVIHRKEHFAHHRDTNHVGADPDLLIVSHGLGGMIKAVATTTGRQIRFYMARHWGEASDRERAVVALEFAFGAAWRLAFLAVAGWKLALLLLVAAPVVGAFVLQALFAWVVHRSFDRTGRYLDTSTIVFPQPIDGIVTALWLFQNYHGIHHLFPRVPFYRYRQLFSRIEDVMVANGAAIHRIGQARPASRLPALEKI